MLRTDIGVSAGVSGVILPRSFVLLGNAEARMLGLRLRGDGLFSSVGLAACVPLKPSSSSKGAVTFRVGFGYRYSTKVIDLMAGSCDVAPWSPCRSAARPARRARRRRRASDLRRAGRPARRSWSRPQARRVRRT